MKKMRENGGWKKRRQSPYKKGTAPILYGPHFIQKCGFDKSNPYKKKLYDLKKCYLINEHKHFPHFLPSSKTRAVFIFFQEG